MDDLSLAAAIGVGALLVLVIFVMPFAARHDWAAARRRRECADDGSAGAVATSVAVFGGDGRASCSSDGGGSC